MLEAHALEHRDVDVITQTGRLQPDVKILARREYARELAGGVSLDDSTLTQTTLSAH